MDEAHFSPQQYMAYYCKQKGITLREMGIAPTVVGCWSTRLAKYMADQVGASRAEHWDLYGADAPVWNATVNGQPVSFTAFRVGAPATVMQMEELIACGARRFIGLGWAGSLQPFAPVGSFLLPFECIREEGTSLHYAAPDAPLGPDPALAAALASAAQAEGQVPFAGPHWSTDAIYRELTSKVLAFRDRGVVGVDMETSAIFAVAAFRGVAAANLLVVSDELWHEWRPAFNTPELRAANKDAVRAVLRVVGAGISHF